MSVASAMGFQPRVMVASPSADFRSSIVLRLRQSSWNADEANGGAEALSKLDSGKYAVLLVDRRLPDLTVEDVEQRVEQSHPEVDLLVIDDEQGAAAQRPPRHPRTQQLFWILKNMERPSPAASQASAADAIPVTVHNFTQTAVSQESSLPGVIASSRLM